MKLIPLLLLWIAVAACAGVVTLRDEDFARVGVGMTRDEVQRLVGKPIETMPFPMSGNVSWDYYYHDTWGYLCRYSVTFGPQGLVVSKISQRLNDGGDHAK